MASVTPGRRGQLTHRSGTRLTGEVLLELAVPVVIVAVWWLLSQNSTSTYFPPLSSMVATLQRFWLFAHFGSDAVPSLLHLAAGYFIATVAGVGLGVVIGLAPPLYRAVTPLLEFLRAIPGVALLPAALLLLGFGATMGISVIAYGTIWPILLSSIDGVRSVDPVVADVTRSYRIGFPSRILRITLPSASPQIVAGMRTALSIGIALIVFSEMLGASHGIGYQLLSSETNFKISQTWAAMLLLGIIGYLLNLGFYGFEHVALRWHRDMRTGGGR
jgi:sulfonate transport system permease protein